MKVNFTAMKFVQYLTSLDKSMNSIHGMIYLIYKLLTPLSLNNKGKNWTHKGKK